MTGAGIGGVGVLLINNPKAPTAITTISTIRVRNSVFPCSGFGVGYIPDMCNSVRSAVIEKTITQTQIITDIGSNLDPPFSILTRIMLYLKMSTLVGIDYFSPLCSF